MSEEEAKAFLKKGGGCRFRREILCGRTRQRLLQRHGPCTSGDGANPRARGAFLYDIYLPSDLILQSISNLWDSKWRAY